MMNARSCDMTEARVTYLLDPPSLASEAAYVAALDELTVLIEEYEARRDGYDLARMRRALADSG